VKLQGKIKPMSKTTSITEYRETNGKLHIFLSPGLKFEWLTSCAGHFYGNYRVPPAGNYEAVKGANYPLSNQASKQAASFETQISCFLVCSFLVDNFT
jgi:hypothetical protein